jgi:hypothetical protein
VAGFHSGNRRLNQVLRDGSTVLLPIFADGGLPPRLGRLRLLRAAPAIGALVIMAALTIWPLTQRLSAIMFASVGFPALKHVYGFFAKKN